MAITMKMARVGANMTQQEVADAMGMHVNTYARFEKDPESISIEDAKKFSKIVNVNCTDIFFSNNSNLIREGDDYDDH